MGSFNTNKSDIENLQLASGFTALTGMLALLERLRDTLGNGVVDEVRQIMLDRQAGFPLSEPSRKAMLREFDDPE